MKRIARIACDFMVSKEIFCDENERKDYDFKMNVKIQRRSDEGQEIE